MLTIIGKVKKLMCIETIRGDGDFVLLYLASFFCFIIIIVIIILLVPVFPLNYYS